MWVGELFQYYVSCFHLHKQRKLHRHFTQPLCWPIPLFVLLNCYFYFFLSLLISPLQPCSSAMLWLAVLYLSLCTQGGHVSSTGRDKKTSPPLSVSNTAIITESYWLHIGLSKNLQTAVELRDQDNKRYISFQDWYVFLRLCKVTLSVLHLKFTPQLQRCKRLIVGCFGILCFNWSTEG